MKITTDETTFDTVQIEMLNELILSIKSSLEQAEVGADKVRGITEELTFQIAALIDGSAAVCHGDDFYLAHLGFSKGETREEIILSEGGSWMHEYAVGAVEDAFA